MQNVVTLFQCQIIRNKAISDGRTGYVIYVAATAGDVHDPAKNRLRDPGELTLSGAFTWHEN